jgi:hypothetical protein
LTWPKSWLSTSDSGIEPTVKVMNGLCLRRLNP